MHVMELRINYFSPIARAMGIIFLYMDFDKQIADYLEKIADIAKQQGKTIVIASYMQEEDEPMKGVDKLFLTYRSMSYLELASAMVQLCNYVGEL